MLDREGAAGPADIAIVGTADEVAEQVPALGDIGVTDFAAADSAATPTRSRRRERRSSVRSPVDEVAARTRRACSSRRRAPPDRVCAPSRPRRGHTSPPTRAGAPTLEWSSCPDLADELTRRVGVHVGRRPARPRPTRPATRSPSPSAAPSSTTATPAARSSSTPAARAVGHRAGLVPRRPAAAGPARRRTTRSAGTRGASAGRYRPSTAVTFDPTSPAPTSETCIDRTGPLLAQVGAADSALDLEAVRVALGVERLDYLGYSYGTALGAVYAMAHPDRVGRFVLDGAIDPTAGDPDGARRRRHARLRRRRDRRRHRPLPRAVRRLR